MQTTQSWRRGVANTSKDLEQHPTICSSLVRNVWVYIYVGKIKCKIQVPAEQYYYDEKDLSILVNHRLQITAAKTPVQIGDYSRDIVQQTRQMGLYFMLTDQVVAGALCPILLDAEEI